MHYQRDNGPRGWVLFHWKWNIDKKTQLQNLDQTSALIEACQYCQSKGHQLVLSISPHQQWLMVIFFSHGNHDLTQIYHLQYWHIFNINIHRKCEFLVCWSLYCTFLYGHRVQSQLWHYYMWSLSSQQQFVRWATLYLLLLMLSARYIWQSIKERLLETMQWIFFCQGGGGTPISVKGFWARWFSVKGGGGNPPIPLRARS